MLSVVRTLVVCRGRSHSESTKSESSKSFIELGHPNSGRYLDMLGNYDVWYLVSRVAARKKNGFCPT